ncbi:class I SAM-dependent methyltransferase [Psychroserpens sp.]|uniref:class I SAM-dependent methyltransferase n=1 Tax=Psychroserpens sp. TaxID=2020870 RepID=UPI001B098EB3|nr:class I SAM-dependent methyltransferase [Psychroserpens sp.]MBO6607318.1 class I SAM-dependent methyltransferase [Psychroserpens sp.]MBO6632098.1 class I SAM-dependent methyltransferase [Psychroserpens sp.]MBO6654606.1 class I SAM-dependent methyltransferase [Psychroserpens sp.]MBO6681047.1 class I SAM-dependent methyltransferase [Psychroserpens sp.]MBO6749998.1 class I SAM-dependent methyltransferase [Psychroserpens sp.]
MTNTTEQWFASWFDTPFYHILYKDRDHNEAQGFMDNLTSYLNIPEHGTILDLACGKGRHSVYLNSLGFDVTGVDLSENSINYAKQFENETLHFDVHDMCKPYHKTFDAVFNLFTSFGYFDKEEDNLKTIKAIKANLNDVGFGVIDFMNSDYVVNNLIAENVKSVDGIDFHQKRTLENGYIVKDISFTAENTDYQYQERVRAFTLTDFQKLFEKAGVYLLDVFGDYKLQKFDKNTSERLVMIFK